MDSLISLGRWLIAALLLVLVPVLVSLAVQITMSTASAKAWWQADNSSVGLSPDADTTPEAVVQVFAARVFGLRGALGVHTWVAFKPAGADHYVRMEVIGWGVRRGLPAVRVHRGIPDGKWYGKKPVVLVDKRGAEAEAIISKLPDAVRSYPHPEQYRVWPGPNSNTFTAHIGREVPEMRLDLPPTAIGKDYLPNGELFASAPSGTGYQFSLWGILGFMAALEEGVEVNLMGLTLGVDAKSPALKLPGLGRVGMPQTATPAGS